MHGAGMVQMFSAAQGYVYDEVEEMVKQVSAITNIEACRDESHLELVPYYKYPGVLCRGKTSPNRSV